MNNLVAQVQILPIPWMKQKLEAMYDKSIFGNLFVMFSNLELDDLENLTSSAVDEILSNCNIIIDDNHPLYLYLPLEVNNTIKKLITIFKTLYNNNVYIILGGYKEFYPTSNELDCIADLYMFYPNLTDTVYNSYLIDSCNQFEIFTSLCDTQRININPTYSCTICGPTLNYHIKHASPKNTTHISFIKLLDESLLNEATDYYLKGLTNKNNNFNFNY